MKYHYLFTDEDGQTLARVAYSFTPLHSNPAEGDELVIDSVIPQDFEIGRREELTLRHHAALLDLDEADSNDADALIERHEERESIGGPPIHWGVKG